MRQRPLDEIEAGLCRASRDVAAEPYSDAGWPEAIQPDSAWCTSPACISLQGTPAWERMDDASRKTLAFWESIAFFSLNIHGEKILTDGLAVRMRRPGGASPYLAHFLDEEVGHTHLFECFCMRYGGRVFRDLAVHASSSDEMDEAGSDLRFFARALIFEELVVNLNAVMARDASLHPLVRQLHAMHMREEQRHLAFGRRIVGELWARVRADCAPAQMEELQDHFGGFVEATWRSFYSSDAYVAAGLAEPYALREAAWTHPVQRARRAQVGQAALGAYVGPGLLRAEAVAP